MVLIPVTATELLAEPARPLFDQYFGLGLPSHVVFPVFDPPSGGYYRPWRHTSIGRSGVSKIVNKRDSFKIFLDVSQFEPEEIKVIVGNKYVKIQAQHGELLDEHGFVSRKFSRRYALPREVLVHRLKCELSTDGVLIISAPKQELAPKEQNIREFEIKQLNTPALVETEEQ